MKKNKQKYFIYGLIACVIGSANATVIRHTTYSVDAIYFNFLRYCLAAIVCLPFFIRYSHKLNLKNVRYSLFSGIALFVATICYVIAIQLSQATYVTLLTLLNPIMLVVLTLRLTKDRVKMKHLAGFSIAAFGALLVVTGPLIAKGNTTFGFYPVATIMILINAVAFPLGIIYARKAGESRKKLPLISTIFIQASVIAALSFATSLAINNSTRGFFNANITMPVVIGAIYSGIGVGVVDRLLTITSYRNIGAAINGGLAYLGIFLSITISVMVLNEKLSLIALVGGGMILLGIYVSEKHLNPQRKHRSLLHRH